MKRKDEWSYEEDLLLAQTVISHIQNKSTQLSAFEEVGERLKRTAAACGFRWNSTVRKKYEAEIKASKEQRNDVFTKAKMKTKSDLTQDNQQELYITVTQTDSNTITPFDPIINSLLEVKNEYLLMQQTIGKLEHQIETLKSQLDGNKSNNDPSEDMNNLMQIIKRAEKMGLFEKYNPKEKPAG
ncbi:RsfA family transcriptional regulator [Paenibacillus sp. ISL-20]|uniref:RsfA family transcriptional regulator n=1 Tax=Paenibacillus sp. ISL-20 TaxID=2819163 RepID=UPI001BE53275|nr:RsfA family transcriptional regulator [Paenibacillus sp. ISL-20]MBT2759903.1 RsfA family transcriptional regulator [Paenibacillus sp. ISL-20]